MRVNPDLAAKILAMPGVVVSSSGTHAESFGDRIVVWINVVVRSKLNERKHWAARARDAKRERTEAHGAIWALRVRFDGPLHITLTRVGGRRMDDDNLAGAFKSIRDGIADALGRDDGSKSIKWEYDQRPRRRGEQAGCEVTIEKGSE